MSSKFQLGCYDQGCRKQQKGLTKATAACPVAQMLQRLSVMRKCTTSLYIKKAIDLKKIFIDCQPELTSKLKLTILRSTVPIFGQFVLLKSDHLPSQMTIQEYHLIATEVYIYPGYNRKAALNCRRYVWYS